MTSALNFVGRVQRPLTKSIRGTPGHFRRAAASEDRHRLRARKTGSEVRRVCNCDVLPNMQIAHCMR